MSEEAIEHAAVDGPVLVIGTGLIGTSIALALSRAGVDVALEDADASALQEAVYRGAGSVLTDHEPSIVVVAVPPAVAAGQMVMLSDGDVQWSSISEGGVTLISTTTPLSDVEEFTQDSLELNPLNPSSPDEDDDPVEDLTPKDAVLLLGAGLLAGSLASFGLNTFNTPG